MSELKVILSLDAIRPPLAGIGRYAHELAKGLLIHPAVEQVRFQFRLGWIDNPDIVLLRCADQVARDSGAGGLSRSFAYPLLRSVARRVSPTFKLARCIRFRDHLYHSPNYELPPFPGRRISTVHDLSVFRHPEFHPDERVQHMRRIFPSMLARGDLFLTDSEFSRREILDYCSLSEDRVVAVHLGVDARYQPLDVGLADPVLRRYGLRYGEYALSVGTIEPRKNLERLIEAYRSLPDAIKRGCPLVLVGNEGWHSAAIHVQISEGQSEGWLRYLAYVNEGDLPALYTGARLFACVSVYEGFGLPVLEAMASGVPVVCSDCASLPEVGGQAVRYVDPLDVESIREGVLALLTNNSECSNRAAMGLAQSQQFTWKRTVNETVSAYARLV